MGDALNKVRPGDPLVIPARAYNAFVDAARACRGRELITARNSQTASPTQAGGGTGAGTVLIRNESGADRDRADVLGVAGLAIDPDANPDAFLATPVLTGVVPSEDSHAHRLAILREPAASGALARAVVAGAAPVRVVMNDADDRFAAVEDGDATQLTSATDTGLTILARQSGTGPRWAVVLLPASGSGAALPEGTEDNDYLRWEADTAEWLPSSLLSK